MKTVVLFFEKGVPTRKIWFYELDPGRNLGKTNPLNDDDLKTSSRCRQVRGQRELMDGRCQSIDKIHLRSLSEEPNKADETALA